MATVGIVRAIVTADVTQLRKGMSDAQRSADKMATKMKAVGKAMSMRVTLPLLAVGGAAAKMASDFEFSMTQIETLVGRSVQEVETLKGSVLGLSGETGRAPKELADAMFFITSAGLDATSATAALEASAKAAAVGLGDTVIVADAVTNAMNGYGMSADGAAFATDVLAKTVEQGKASAADLAPQFGRLIPMAAELGISFDQVGGGLAFLTRASGDAAMSATQLGGVMKSFLKPSQAAKKVLGEIGIDLHDLRAAASEDLLGALQGLREKLEASGYEMSNVFEDIRGLNGALQLTGVATGAARDVFDELADSSGKLDEAFRGVQKTSQFKLSQSMSGLKASMITLGAAILPVVVPIIAKLAAVISKLAEGFGALPGPVQKIIVVLGVLLAAAGPVLMIVGAIKSALITLNLTAALTTTALSAVILPLLAIVAAAAVLIAIWKHFSDQSKEAQERTDTLRASFVNAENDAGAFKAEVEGLRTELDALNDAADAAAEGTDALANGFGELDSAGLLLAELIGRDVRKEFNLWMTDMEHHNDLMVDGSDKYEELADSLYGYDGMLDTNLQTLRDHSGALGEDADKILEAVRVGNLEVDVLKDMLYAMDDTADAHDDLAKDNKKLAKAWLENTDNVVAYVQALDEETIAQIEAAEEAGNYVEAATLAIDATAHATEVAANARAESVRQAEAQAGVVAMLAETSAAFDTSIDSAAAYSEEMGFGKHSANMMADSSSDLHDRLVSLRAITPEARAVLARFNTNIEAGIDPLGRYGEALRDIATEATSADRALLQAASGGQAMTDALEFDTSSVRTTYPLYEKMVEDHAEIADRAAEITGEYRDQAAALSEQLAAGDITVAQARAGLALLERQTAQLDEALALEVEIADEIERQEDALQVLKDAQQELIDLQEDSLALAEEKLAALEAEADAARAPVQALKAQAEAQREGFDALRGMAQAENDLADAAQNVVDIEAELEAVRAGGGRLVAEATEAYEKQGEVVAGLVAKETGLEAKRKQIADKILDVEKQKADIALAGSELRLELEAKLASAQSKRDAANEKGLAIAAKIADAEARHVAVAEAGSELRLRLQKKLVQAARAEEDARAKVLDIEDDIAVVAARIADINDATGEFQREITYELNEQRLAYYDIGEQVAKLEDQQAGLTQQAIASQMELIAALGLEQAAISEVEQALLDLEIITAADAAEAAVTARQAQGLIRLREELAETEAQVASGEATTLDLIVAQEEYNKALAAALSPIDGMSEAVSDLARMEKEAERIGLQLAVARDKEAKTLEAKTKLENSATLVADADAAANAELTDLEGERTRAEELLAEATAELTAAGEIEIRVAEAQAKISLELTKLRRDQTAADNVLTAAETALSAAGEIEAAVTEAQAVVEEKLIALREKEQEAADRVTEATNAVTAAKAIETAMSDVHSRAVEEEARLVALLERALWDQVAADYGVEAAQIRLAESGDLASDAIDRMTEASPSLAAELILLQDDAAKAYPQFDAMRTTLLELEPQIQSATTEVNNMATALGGLVMAMETLNRTKIDVIEVPTATTAGTTTGTTTSGDYYENGVLVRRGGEDVASTSGGLGGLSFDAAILSVVGDALTGLTSAAPVLTDAELAALADIFPSAQSGGFVKSGGLVNVHAGETITPAGGGGVTVIVNVEGSVSSERDLVESIRKGLLQAQKSGRAVVLN